MIIPTTSSSAAAKSHSNAIKLASFALLSAIGVNSGCGGPSRIEPPSYDPDAISKALVEKYDANGDDLLSRDELQACPGILTGLERFDSDSDGAVSTDEVAERVKVWAKNRIALMRLKCKVLYDGKPLAGAKVEFIPEEVFAGIVMPSSGITTMAGIVEPSISSTEMPDDLSFKGTNMGLFKVRITHPNINIPVKYNTETILGLEITKDLNHQPVFNLES